MKKYIISSLIIALACSILGCQSIDKQQVQQQEAVIAGSFHDVVMLSDSKRTDELTHSRGCVRESLSRVAVR